MSNKLEQNREKFESLITELLKLMDNNSEREGLKGTPHRVWKYWNELLEGQWITNDEIANNATYNKCFEGEGSDDLIVESHIKSFSHCEHHLALMYDLDISIGYIPNGKVIGLSKMARIVDICCKRLQLQERIGEDIADILMKILDTKNIAVIISGKHGCMTARGIKSKEALTKTACLNGRFKESPELRNELYSLIK